MTYRRYFGTILLAGALLLIPLAVFAAEFRAGDQPSLSSSENISGNLYIAGGNVTANGTVRGDLVAAGGSLLLNGPVSGDVAAGGGNITILGDIGGDVRAGGGNVVVQGRVGGDVVVGGGQINLASPNIGGDVAIGGGSIRIDSPIVGSLKVGGGEVYINARIGRNVDIQADKITLGPAAVIEGDFSYSSRKEAVLEEGAVVRGETTFTPLTGVEDIGKMGFAVLLSLGLITKFFITLAGAFAVMLIFRRFSETLVRTAMMRPFFELGRGFIFLVVAPVASVILLLTIVGAPLGFLGLAMFIATLIFTSIVAPIVIGSVVHRWVLKPADYEISWKTILLGAAIYALLGIIPFVGWIVKFAVILITLGAVLSIKWRAVEEWR